MTRSAATRARQRTDATEVQENDLMAIVTFVKVLANPDPNHIKVQNIDNNMTFEVKGRELVEQMFSADRYTSEESLTKTQLAEKLISLYNKPFTVIFEKQNGELRTLRGRLMSAEPLLGRSNVEDLDVTTGFRMRQVDHRTLQSITVDGVKFNLKK